MTHSSTSRVIILIAVIAMLALGCASVPVVRAWRPWVQTNKAPQEIPLHASFSIKVEGEAEPLIGDEKLMQASVESELARLLQRRGFVIAESNADYTVTLKYMTTERESFDMTSWNSSSLAATTGLFGGNSRGRGWGVVYCSPLVRSVS